MCVVCVRVCTCASPSRVSQGPAWSRAPHIIRNDHPVPISSDHIFETPHLVSLVLGLKLRILYMLISTVPSQLPPELLLQFLRQELINWLRQATQQAPGILLWDVSPTRLVHGPWGSKVRLLWQALYSSERPPQLCLLVCLETGSHVS